MEPECAPLRSLDSVLSWKPPNADDVPFAKVTLSAQVKVKNVPRTLVCHDMKGGYLEDRFIQGSCNHQAYRFYHWQLIDTFIYFSHHFCTVPPPCWIDAAHRHDVRVLGTLITEWDEGKAVCKNFLQDKNCVSQLVRKLVDIARFYRFEGWLINIENNIEVDHISSLKSFVELLSNTMHEEIAHSQVLWYDSVTDAGKLDWQDQLNDKNKDFFSCCDGIFLNYCWNEEKLRNSGEVADQTGRRHDVYVGVDVFGRGCPGGGGYNTKEALEMIRKENLSAAIFAPGWVHETQEMTEFTSNQNKFWKELLPFCNSHPISYLPLVTSFCQGNGKKYFLHGQCVGHSPWYNLSLQQVQAKVSVGDSGTSSALESFVFEEEAYLGGGCVRVQGHFNDTAKTLCLKLFEMDVKVFNSLLVTYTYKHLSGPQCSINMALELQNGAQEKQILLVDNSSQKDKEPDKKKCKTENTEVFSLAKGNVVKHFGVVPEVETDWKTCHFLVESAIVSNCTLKSVNLVVDHQVGLGNFSLLLGQVQILPEDCVIKEYPRVSDLTCTKYCSSSASQPAENKTFKLKWTCTDSSCVQYYNVYSWSPGLSHQLCGHTTLQTYVLVTDKTRTAVQMVVQPVTTVGVAVPVRNCSACVLPVDS